MGMRNSAVEDFGLVIDEEVGKYMLDKLSKETGREFDEDDDDVGYMLYEEGICEYIPEFTGEVFELNNEGNPMFSSDKTEYYQYDSVFYVPLMKRPSLFKQAYVNMEDIIRELKGRVGKYLPEGFDYRGNLRNISGVYYG